jgi:superfamily II DNA helicase RecQ
MAPSSAPNLSEVAAVLERFLCPGGKLRLSPYVEATQCSVLLGARPDPNRHVPSLRELLNQPAHEARMDAIAQQMQKNPGIRFGDAFFADRDLLDLYFAHYFPANLGKLQLVLLDLLRAGRFPEKLHLVDLGVGPGTSFVAVLDFVLALGAMADLTGTALPLRELSLRGYDRSRESLRYTRDVLGAMGEILTAYRMPPPPCAGQALTLAWKLVEKALADVRMAHVDISGTEAIDFVAPSLVVLSYVLNDLYHQDNMQAFEARMSAIPEDSLLIVMEPGDADSASQLMRWRKSLVHRKPHLYPILPCGHEFGVQLPASCDHCWCARRQDIHTSPLQRAYRNCLRVYTGNWEPKRQAHLERCFERLSWSYCVLASCPHQERRECPPLQHGIQRYIGQRRSDRTGTLSVAEEVGTAKLTQELRLVAFCPARIDANAAVCRSAVLVQEPGQVLPPLRFGELVEFENVAAQVDGVGIRFTMNRDSRIRPVLPEANSACYEALPASLNALAQRLFGFSSLHDFQHKIIRRVLAGLNTLGIAATASGKTECFLLPALLVPGLTIVVSPLKSLMQDQWERCDERYGLGALTTYINGDVDYRERVYRLQGMRAGRYKLAYFTPEQLARSHVRAVLRQTHVSVLAMDEAHCVSQWGHDFRPDYLNMIRRLRTCWETPPVIVALTATAGERVRHDLCHPSLLNLNNEPVEEGGHIVFHGSNRPELDLIVRVVPDAAARSRSIVEDLRPFTQPSAKGSAIVFLPYTGVRDPGQNEGEYSAAVEPFAGWLERQLNQRVAIYHGQMSEGTQTEVGTFVRTRWHREDNGWGVYLFQRPEGSFPGVGHLRAPSPGIRYRMVGHWEDVQQYGERQFLFHTCVPADETALAIRPLGDVAARDRRAEQRAFMHSQHRIMVATKGFGMGIDKADIRLVIHHSPPGDLLSYAQEVGRAARDGERGRVILYYTEGSLPNRTRQARTDRRIQELFIEGRYVRECDLRAGIAFLRQYRRWFEVREQGAGYRTYAVLSFREVEAYFSSLARNPATAGLRCPYEWPANKERQKVIQLTLEVLFKTVVMGGQQSGTTVLESCHEVNTCLRQPIALNWQGLEDSNAELLRGVLHQAEIGQEEFEDLCGKAVTEDLLPLAQRLNCTVEDTGRILWEASHLRVIGNLRLGTRAASPNEKSWEVCLSPALLSGKGLDELITSVVSAHQRRQDEDRGDWQLMLREYVGIEAAGPPSRRCLRRVLLAFLGQGEDIVDEGCGACSSCCPDENFVPLAERAGRIITIPAELWSRLEAIRKAIDYLPDMEVFSDICAFLEREDGVRWRHSVWLNAERLLREDSDSAGATALMICLISHGWAQRDESHLHRLFDVLWRKRAAHGRRLRRLAEAAAAVRPSSIVLAYWRARSMHAEDPASGLPCWRALLEQEGVPREYIHEAASALAANGDVQCALQMARASKDVEEACAAYSGLRDIDLRSPAFIRDESVAIFATAGNERARADTFAGLLVASVRRGGSSAELVPILDTHWLRIEPVLSNAALAMLLEAFPDRQVLLETLMTRWLAERPYRWQEAAQEALEALHRLHETLPYPTKDRLSDLASRADCCPVHAAAYVAWLEHHRACSEESMGWRDTLLRLCGHIGLARKRSNPPRGNGISGCAVRDDALVADFRRVLRDLDSARNNAVRTNLT